MKNAAVRFSCLTVSLCVLIGLDVAGAKDGAAAAPEAPPPAEPAEAEPLEPAADPAEASAAEAPAPDEFTACVTELQATALQSGISQRVVDEVLGRVERVERVIELDRRQPEFTQTFTDYYNRRVTRSRVERGRELLGRHRDLLQRLERRYGVPAQYLVAFWGLETNFGSFFGDLRVPDSLATLACDQRRSAYFASELMEALRIVDAGDVSADRMIGSWAGAMGHVQFMPSVFQRYAVDADGDGRRDLWASIPDALASAANFLSGLGWNRGLRWGREVLLPEGFDYGLTGRHQARPLAEWVDLGVTDAFGRALPRLDLQAAVLVPSGDDGPAFLVYDNFDVIMRWNRSEFYALSVGRLADEIAGAGPLRRPPPANAVALTRDQILQLQRDLGALGYDIGEADGVVGPATRRALSLFQRDRDLVADGHPDAAALDAVRQAAVESLRTQGREGS
ncbi:MAG TPA: lytic murein transglycosylase [Pseudomonadales bacterium]